MLALAHPSGSQGFHVGRCWIHFGDMLLGCIFEIKVVPNSMPNIFFEHECCEAWVRYMCFGGFKLTLILDVSGGAARGILNEGSRPPGICKL